MKNLLLVLFLVFMTGCAVKTKNADFSSFKIDDKKQKYPDIGLVMTSEELQYFKEREAVINALNESKMFKSIQINNPYLPFSMELNLNLQIKDLDSASGFSKMMLSAGTLFLIPVDVNYEVVGKAKLRYKGIIFDEIPLNTKFITSFSMYKMGSKDIGIKGAYRKAIEQLLQEIKKRDSFKRSIKEESKGLAI